MTCHAEQAQDLLGGGALAEALLRVNWYLLDPFAFHRAAQVPFDERLDEKSQEIQGRNGLDAHHVFEEDGRDLVHGLDLFEAFRDGWLPFMGFEGLGGAQVAVVANERIHAVALALGSICNGHPAMIV
jgi:hypothetical protein